MESKLDFQFEYVGDGPDKEAFLKTVETLSLSDRVTLSGFLPSEELAKKLASSDLYVMSSHMEGWPTSLVEAFAVGLPMVSTSVSGAQDIIEEGANGFICKTRDPKEMADLILMALSLDKAKVFEASPVERFSSNTLHAELSSLIEGLRTKGS